MNHLQERLFHFLKKLYFTKRDEKILFSEIHKFLHTYNNLPTKEAILIELNNRKDLNEEEYKTRKRVSC